MGGVYEFNTFIVICTLYTLFPLSRGKGGGQSKKNRASRYLLCPRIRVNFSNATDYIKMDITYLTQFAVYYSQFWQTGYRYRTEMKLKMTTCYLDSVCAEEDLNQRGMLKLNVAIAGKGIFPLHFFLEKIFEKYLKKRYKSFGSKPGYLSDLDPVISRIWLLSDPILC